MRTERWSFGTVKFLAAFLLLALLAGCGGGGGDSSSAPSIDDTLFTPNYVSDLPVLLHWDHLPIRVAFDLPSDWTTRYASNPIVHLDAANEWNQDGEQSLIQVVMEGQQDVLITFEDSLPGTTLGLTEYSYDASSWEMVSSSIRVSLTRPAGGNIPTNDMQVIIAHEIGHAIGIGGHSSRSTDLMYSSHTFGTLRFCTERDLNTAMTAYPAYFGYPTKSLPGVRGIPDIRTEVIE